MRFQRANLEKRRIAREEEKERDEEDALRSTDIGEQARKLRFFSFLPVAIRSMDYNFPLEEEEHFVNASAY